MKAQSIVALVLLSALSVPAVAGTTAVPEPGVVELLAISAVAAIAIAVRNRRK